MQSNTYIPQRYKSAVNGLKNGFLHYITKYGQICNPTENYIGFNAPERLGVHVGRTTEGSDHPNDWGSMRSNDLGLRQAERLTSINKDLTL